METKKRFLTKKESAAYCGMTQKVFDAWFATGRIPSVPTTPKANRHKIVPARLDEFLAWLETDEAKSLESVDAKV